MARPVSNHDLDRLLSEAGYGRGHATFARQVNHAGRALGALRYDAASVYWWLRGRRPHDDVQQLMVDVISRKLGRRINIEDLGFSVADNLIGTRYPGTPDEAVDTATALWRLLVRQRTHLDGVPFVAAAAVEAGFAWRFDSADADVSRLGRGRVVPADVAALELCAAQFVDLDRRHGGGADRTRAVVAEFLNRQVTPMLHSSYTDQVGRQLLRAAAVLTGQLGFMSYDAGRHGAAQRHFITALRLAKASGDQLYGAHLLANLATQAVYLGQARAAVQLSRAAVEGARRGPAWIMARLHTTEATANAVAGDRQACTASLRRAAAAVERDRFEDAPPWATYFSHAHFAGTAVRCFRDLGMPSVALRYAPAALALSADNHRTRALHTALLATTHAQHGQLDAACELGERAAELSRSVHSNRVRERLGELRGRLRAHRNDDAVARLLDRLVPLAPST